MEALVFTLILLLAIVACTRCEDFCIEQKRVYSSCASDLSSAFMRHGQDVEKLCRKLVKFRSCQHDTYVTCPDALNLTDPTNVHAHEQIESILKSMCHTAPENEKCSDGLVYRMVTRCTALTNNVQPLNDDEQMCRLSEELVLCLRRVVATCQDSAALLDMNVHAAIASSQSAAIQYCAKDDILLQDMPQQAVNPDPLTPCSEDMALTEITRCVQMIQQAELDNNLNCRSMNRFISCVNRVIRNCPELASDIEHMMSNIRTAVQSSC